MHQGPGISPLVDYEIIDLSWLMGYPRGQLVQKGIAIFQKKYSYSQSALMPFQSQSPCLPNRHGTLILRNISEILRKLYRAFTLLFKQLTPALPHTKASYNALIEHLRHLTVPLLTPQATTAPLPQIYALHIALISRMRYLRVLTTCQAPWSTSLADNWETHSFSPYTSGTSQCLQRAPKEPNLTSQTSHTSGYACSLSHILSTLQCPQFTTQMPHSPSLLCTTTSVTVLNSPSEISPQTLGTSWALKSHLRHFTAPSILTHPQSMSYHRQVTLVKSLLSFSFKMRKPKTRPHSTRSGPESSVPVSPPRTPQ